MPIRHKIYLFCLTFCVYFIPNSSAQVNIISNQTAAVMAQSLTGQGVIIINPVLTCPQVASGIFSVVSSNFGLDSGLILTSGRAETNGTLIGANTISAAFANTNNNAAGDPQLTTLANQPTNDACILEFDFAPAGDSIKFDYVFGSEEYNGPHGNYNCSINDVFGFFISGPGYATPTNIALIPNTTIPVGVSTVNDGVGAAPNNSCYTNTLGNGPYTQYYNLNNQNSITYTGFTDVFTAVAQVNPCDTYHLKLAIADGSDFAFDSGVFLKAGSLTSNTISIASQGASNLATPAPYCVRGCEPGQFVFKRETPRPTPLVIKYQIAGTATNGIDYVQIPDSIIIPANDTVAIRYIQALTQPLPQGVENVKLRIYNPYVCNSTTPSFIDSAEIDIRDSFYVEILTPDTAVCENQAVNIVAVGDPQLEYTWSPAGTIAPINSLTPVATPNQTTTYVLSAHMPGSGCPTSHDYITIDMKPKPIVNLGNDTTICIGKTYQMTTQVSPPNLTYTFSWSPVANLSNPNIQNPVASPTATSTFTVSVNSGAFGCDGTDDITISVLPDDFNLLTPDTAICKGNFVSVRVDGDPNFSYTWTPSIGVVTPNQSNPVITPDTTRQYTITARFPGCDDMVKKLTIDVQPVPTVSLGNDREMCEFDTLWIQPNVMPDWYNQYSYSWTPVTNVNPSSVQRDIYFDGSANETLKLTVSTPAGCVGDDEIDIIVHPGNFASVTPLSSEICPYDSVSANINGGVLYQWTPAHFVSDPTSANVILDPPSNTTFTILVTDEFGCRDTLQLPIRIFANALLSLPDSVVLYPGEAYELNPATNALYFNWFPQNYLSNTSIANPIATPPVSTRYYVTGTTENGCIATDSIDLIVDPSEFLHVPNAFTPGSFPNEKLRIIKRGVASLNYLRIFNRWGQKVYESNDIEAGWDGTFNGQPQPLGVYIWTLEAQTKNGIKISKQGNVTLIR